MDRADADSKLIVQWFVGARGGNTAKLFIDDQASRLANRVQLTSDGLKAYLEAVEGAFGAEVDYARCIDAGRMGGQMRRQADAALTRGRDARARCRPHSLDDTSGGAAQKQVTYGRLWGHVRDERPFGGSSAPGAVFYYSPNRVGEYPEREHPCYTGIMPADT